MRLATSRELLFSVAPVQYVSFGPFPKGTIFRRLFLRTVIKTGALNPIGLRASAHNTKITSTDEMDSLEQLLESFSIPSETLTVFSVEVPLSLRLITAKYFILEVDMRSLAPGESVLFYAGVDLLKGS